MASTLDPDPEQRKRADLDTLRALAWLVQRDRYRLQRMRPERIRKTAVTVHTFIVHVEAPDLYEAEAAVREALRRPDG